MALHFNYRSIIRVIIAKPLITLIGRRNFYRLALFFLREVRRDVANDFRNNGEQVVQNRVLETAKSLPIIVFDVGANVGEWTKCIVERAKEEARVLQVHAFEPCKGTFTILTQHLRESGASNVTAVNKACSSSVGTAAMKLYGCDTRINTICEPIGNNPQQSGTEEVQLTTIDDYCSAMSIAYIDLLKIDAEGHDYEVIAGAASMLRSRSIGVMQFEYNWRWIGARRYLRDVFSLLGPLNYSIGKLTASGIEVYPFWRWEMETFWEGNYVAYLPQTGCRFAEIYPAWIFPPYLPSVVKASDSGRLADNRPRFSAEPPQTDLRSKKRKRL